MMQFLWRYVDDLIGKGLTLDVLMEFMWYMGLMLVPQAIPLAILLSSLITYGNLGESSELTAIKAAGVSLLKSMRGLIMLVVLLSVISFYFQDVIGPEANKRFAQLLLSMKQKSPELEIPEGIFYDGLPNTNLFVTRKDIETGHLHGVIIYRQSGSYEDQAIILADSGMLQSTAEKKHLLLTLWNGEWFENMRSQDIGGTAEVPYRRETFAHKEILLDFDDGFNLADASGIASSAKAKSTRQIMNDLDSIRHFNDSTGQAFYREVRQYVLWEKPKEDSTPRAEDTAPSTSTSSEGKPAGLSTTKEESAVTIDVDSIYDGMDENERRTVAREAAREAQNMLNDMNVKSDYASFLNRQERTHQIEAIGKFTLALSCIIFFFIGAPLGAIIRKGGLGVPVIISVLVFIVYYIFENSGMRMARDDFWTVWFGKGISTMVLAPLAIFFTYKANRDSTVFNWDAYRLLMMRLFGMRQKRNIMRKEVIMENPHYDADAATLLRINTEIAAYHAEHNLRLPPNPLKVFFRPGDDHRIEEISEQLEEVIEDLGNTRDKVILHELNNYPVLATRAHTRPFRRRWLNALTGVILPLGLFFYLRMVRFRLRLHRDLNAVEKTNSKIVGVIGN